jgi:hypothetical protein
MAESCWTPYGIHCLSNTEVALVFVSGKEII